MKRYAIISDIHGNVHALRAVLARMAQLDVQEVICLGDIVGYGPSPNECLDLVVKFCSVSVRGNHDEAVIDLRCASQFNGAARLAIHWTHDVLGPLHRDALNRLKYVEHIDDCVTCVHDCPVPAPSDYVHDATMAAMAFSGMTTPICLLGHTHVPLVFETDITTGPVSAGDVVTHITCDGVSIPLEPDRRYICNPGSVGQPRDADPRASFAVLDLNDRTFTVHREAYDIAAAQLETQEAGLPNILAERLAMGA
jgi:predicted phosphodiesterase